MSRTKKGKRGAGYEYGSRRGYGWMTAEPQSKRITSKLDRKRAKGQAKKEANDEA